MPTESRFSLRLPTELYDMIRIQAEQNGKSTNEYIVYVLSDYHHVKSDLEQRIDELEKIVFGSFATRTSD